MASVERMECLHHCICCQKVKDLEIVMDDTLLCIYPGMAKDIGDLTLRVDKFEDLMGRLADSGSDLSAACITLEECIEIDREDIVDICKRISNLETSLKSLKEEVAAIPRFTYVPSAPSFTSPNITGSYNPCLNCQTLAEFNRLHQYIYVGDTPCSMCLNNPGRVTSK